MIDELDLSKFEGHTPGPWRDHRDVIVSDMPSGEFETKGVAYYGDGMRHAGGLQYGPERDANGALIAAAPALLAEVKRLRAWRDRLREPTLAMEVAGLAADPDCKLPAKIFRAMLDAAAATPLTDEEIDAATEIWSPKHAKPAEK